MLCTNRLVLASVVLLCCLPVSARAQQSPILVGTVVKVTDGDTIKVQLSSGPITVRLDSIDTPEKGQPWGKEAKQALSRLVDGKRVKLEPVTQDRYERLVAQVFVDGASVNKQLAKEGHAWAFRRYLKRDTGPEYCRLEAAARAAKRGLWSLPDDDWVYPPDWRRLKDDGTDEYDDFRQESAADCIGAIGKQ